MGAGFMSMTAIVLWMFPSAIANLYFADDAANADVIVLAVVFLRVAAAFQICRRASGRGRAPVWRSEGRAHADVDRRVELLAGGISRLPMARLRMAPERSWYLDRSCHRPVRRGGAHVLALLVLSRAR